ncbi:hypothetical protein ACOMHN_051440 [Nucella lapillus]
MCRIVVGWPRTARRLLVMTGGGYVPHCRGMAPDCQTSVGLFSLPPIVIIMAHGQKVGQGLGRRGEARQPLDEEKGPFRPVCQGVTENEPFRLPPLCL